MLTVRRALETPLLPSMQAILAHEPGGSSSTDGKAAVLQISRHTGTAIGFVRQRVGRAHVRQHHHVLVLPMACWPVLQGAK